MVPAGQQTIEHTASRCAQPRAWTRAVIWLVGAGLHPRAGETTLAVARDLAARMDYSLGYVLYDLDGTARRTGTSRATVKRHVSYLRELGALVWVRHGSRRNLHLPGRKYAGTATIYAAVIPPEFDVAMGHRIGGAGYEARVIGVTEAGRERAVQEVREQAARRTSTRAGGSVRSVPRARRAGGSTPCSIQAGEGREPHSPGEYPVHQKVQVSGGLKDTRKRAPRKSPTKKRSNSDRCRGTGRPALQVAADVEIARHVRPRVSWTQRAGLRQLAFALRPLIDLGLTADAIVIELTQWSRTEHSRNIGLEWRPHRPAAYITARLRSGALDDVVPPAPSITTPAEPEDQEQTEKRARHRANTAMHLMCIDARAQAAAAQRQAEFGGRTPKDRAMTRAAGAMQPEQIIDYLQQYGEVPAAELYGLDLLTWAVGLPHLRHTITYDVWAPESSLTAHPVPAPRTRSQPPQWDIDLEFAAAITPLLTEDPPGAFPEPSALGTGPGCPGLDDGPCGKPAVTSLCRHHLITQQATPLPAIHRPAPKCPGDGARPCDRPTLGTLGTCARHHAVNARDT